MPEERKSTPSHNWSTTKQKNQKKQPSEDWPWVHLKPSEHLCHGVRRASLPRCGPCPDLEHLPLKAKVAYQASTPEPVRPARPCPARLSQTQGGAHTDTRHQRSRPTVPRLQQILLEGESSDKRIFLDGPLTTSCPLLLVQSCFCGPKEGIYLPGRTPSG